MPPCVPCLPLSHGWTDAVWRWCWRWCFFCVPLSTSSRGQADVLQVQEVQADQRAERSSRGAGMRRAPLPCLLRLPPLACLPFLTSSSVMHHGPMHASPTYCSSYKLLWLKSAHSCVCMRPCIFVCVHVALCLCVLCLCAGARGDGGPAKCLERPGAPPSPVSAVTALVPHLALFQP